MINIYDGNNVMLRDLEKFGHLRIGLRRRYETAADATPGTEIWCWDGYQHNERRRELYAPYKMNRTPMAEDRFAQIKLFREALKYSNAVQVECATWEADDVISSLAHRLICKKVPVTVHSNDLDYWQL